MRGNLKFNLYIEYAHLSVKPFVWPLASYTVLNLMISFGDCSFLVRNSQFDIFLMNVTSFFLFPLGQQVTRFSCSSSPDVLRS